MEKNLKQFPTGETITSTPEDQLLSLGFTACDLDQIAHYGISHEQVLGQMKLFIQGIPKIALNRPASVGDGILKLSESDFKKAAASFDKKKIGLKVTKFIPASGAASRMFKFLLSFLNDFDIENETINAYINRKKAEPLATFLAGKDKLPFYRQIREQLTAIYTDNELRESDRRAYHFIKILLDKEHFDFCSKPKGVLPFHKYDGHIATPIEEHLNEGARYASANGVSNLHFTVSEMHRKSFEKIIDEVKTKIEKESGVKINVAFSYQDSATDSISVNPDNTPFRDSKGKLFFRPAGHGSLINNLNTIDADVIFIKNIDNVIQNHIEIITLYKKALGGILLEVQERVFFYLSKIHDGVLSEDEIKEMIVFLGSSLHIDTGNFDTASRATKIALLTDKLNRPIRVCGMVRNEGEPGGGPFWVVNSDNTLSLQIVESAQIDLHKKKQAKILGRSTFFNPVDLVCGITDFRGNSFDLSKYVDNESGFIVTKNKEGRELKSYELPGLWNGAMCKWNTLFVEVPLVTFNPVKTVNDLLKPAHQPNNEQG